MLWANTSYFHYCAFRSQISLQANNPTSFCYRNVDGVDHSAISFTLNKVEFFTHRSASCCHAIFVHQASLTQLFHHNRHTTYFVKIFGNVLTTWLQINEIWGITENFTHVIKMKLQTRFVSNRWQMQPSISRSTCAGNNTCRIF